MNSLVPCMLCTQGIGWNCHTLSTSQTVLKNWHFFKVKFIVILLYWRRSKQRYRTVIFQTLSNVTMTNLPMVMLLLFTKVFFWHSQQLKSSLSAHTQSYNPMACSQFLNLPPPINLHMISGNKTMPFFFYTH